MGKQAPRGVSLAVKAQDSRYPINIFLDGDTVPKFTLKFNPGDPFLAEYASNIQNLDTPGADADAMMDFVKALEDNFDAIFGEGSAKLVFKYDSPDRAIMYGALQEVRKGIEDYKGKAEAAEKASKTKAAIDAKRNAAAYIAPK
ncbi:MAG: hypothetical protein FWC66_05175 [Oscillospiraceae bacterium]|nr:hypothetical protein [Oscillospiraceae bacterium]